MRAKDRVPLGEAGYMRASGSTISTTSRAQPQPGIAVMQDLDDDQVGYGAFWGEVQSNVHKALGCLGTVTNGSIRDIPHDRAGLPDAGRLDPAVARLRARRRLRAQRERPRHGGARAAT